MKRILLSVLPLFAFNIIYGQYSLKEYVIPELKMKCMFYSDAKLKSQPNGYNYEYNYSSNGGSKLNAGLLIDTMLRCANMDHFKEYISRMKNNLNNYEIEHYHYRELGSYKISISGIEKTDNTHRFITIYSGLYGTLTFDIRNIASETPKSNHWDAENSVEEIENWQRFPKQQIELPLYGRLVAAPAEGDEGYLIISDCSEQKATDLKALVRVTNISNMDVTAELKKRWEYIDNDPRALDAANWDYDYLSRVESAFKLFDAPSAIFEYRYKLNDNSPVEILVKEYQLVKSNQYLITYKVLFPFMKGYDFRIEEETNPIGNFDTEILNQIITRIKIIT
ncbi:MAG TPA: hypothetical protein PLD87_10870 [Bacteroidia bacterium]|nr:hypothetical protein [Bacteroidia bacterium]